MLSSTSTGAPAATWSPAGDWRGDDEGGGGGAQHATLVAADPVGHSVDLDEVDRSVGGGDEAVATALDGQPAGVRVDALQVGVEAARGRRRDATRNRCGPVRDDDLVHGAAQLQVDRPPDLVLHLRPAAMGGLQQAVELDLLLASS